MFSKLFSRNTPAKETPKAPEILGLRLGGAFELDSLKLRLIEPELVIEGAATTHLIQSVGEVKLDAQTTVLRFYTDDDAFVQVLLEGGTTEHCVADVKLWYFYDTQGVGSQQEWDGVLDNTIAQPQLTFEGSEYTAVWQNTNASVSPVAMTEKTYAADGTTSHTDQFAMLYERQINAQLFEYLMLAGEEKIIGPRADRCLVRATGFDLQPTDIDIIG
ncbi:MAG: YjfK family protein [Pseudomonadales bacterium]